MRNVWAWMGLVGAGLVSVGAAWADPIPAVQSASNMEIIGHSDLNGAGKGGEGLALRQYPDGRRVLFLAHESAPMCVSIIDVSKAGGPKVITQIPNPGPQLRCNNLGLSGTIMAVAHQTDKQGQPVRAWRSTTSPIRRIRGSCRISTPPARIRAACTICGSQTGITPT